MGKIEFKKIKPARAIRRNDINRTNPAVLAGSNNNYITENKKKQISQ